MGKGRGEDSGGGGGVALLLPPPRRQWEELLLSFFECLFWKNVCSNRYRGVHFYFAPAVCYAGKTAGKPFFIAIWLKLTN